MKILKGIGVSPGIAIGNIIIIDSDEYLVPRRTVHKDSIPDEIRKLNHAFEISIKELADLEHEYNKIGEIDTRDIFAVHRFILQDISLKQNVVNKINQEMVTAEFAVFSILYEIQCHLKNLKEPYINQRAYDFVDIRKRLIKKLVSNEWFDLANINEEVIVIAKELVPSQTVELNTKHIQGIATELGGETSHASIVAKSCKIPAVVGVQDLTSIVRCGDTIVVDGIHGKVIVNPDKKMLEECVKKRELYLEYEKKLIASTFNKPCVTNDGVTISLLSNIEFPEEIERVLRCGVDGVGLFRTEFLFLNSDNIPNEQQQFLVYKKCLEQLNGKPLVFRTIDFGGDKFPRNLPWDIEKNPYLGLRSIRYCLRNKSIFKIQLKAILRAAIYGNAKIMFPLITKIRELHQIRSIISDVVTELEQHSIEYKSDIEIGMMVETPSAALLSKKMANHVDFFSLGTNDLIQYTLAVDRGNEQVASLYSAADPAVLKLIQMTVDNGYDAGVDVSICGEMASDPKYVMLLLGMGIRTFSVNPGMITEIRSIICDSSIDECKTIAKRVLAMEDDADILNHLANIAKRFISI